MPEIKTITKAGIELEVKKYPEHYRNHAIGCVAEYDHNYNCVTEFEVMDELTDLDKAILYRALNTEYNQITNTLGAFRGNQQLHIVARLIAKLCGPEYL